MYLKTLHTFGNNYYRVTDYGIESITIWCGRPLIRWSWDDIAGRETGYTPRLRDSEVLTDDEYFLECI